MSTERSFWLGVAAAAHVRQGVEGGFAQLGHGKHLAVKSLEKGDLLAYYAPRETLEGGAAVQAFTAVGEVISNAPYQVHLPSGFAPWRVDICYFECTPAPIRPLLDDLELTRSRGSKWGMAVRGSKSRLSAADMALICAAMGAKGVPL